MVPNLALLSSLKTLTLSESKMKGIEGIMMLLYNVYNLLKLPVKLL